MTNIKPKVAQGAFARRLRSLPGAALMTAITGSLVLTGCGAGSTNAGSDSPAASPSASAQAAVAVDEKVASLLPAEYKGRTLKAAFEAGNLPLSDYTQDKKSMQGLDYDLMQAAASVLGVKVEYEGATGPTMIPGVQGGRYDIALAGWYDTPTREKIVDVATYATDGEILIAKKGGKTDVTEETLCGLKVSLTAGSAAAGEEMPARSKKCVDEGKQPIEIQTYPTQGEQYLAVASGRADILNTAASNGLYLIKTQPNDFEQAGKPYGTIEIGALFQKDSRLSEAVAAAFNKLIEDGTYGEIFEKWGLKNAAIDESKVNPASAK